MIFIGIDISKISTALCIEKDNNNIFYSYSTKKSNNIWVKNTEKYINYRNINYDYDKENDYSKSEILKIKQFDNVSNLIINDILDNINILDNIQIGIEGYSYNSKRGPIIDIVEFSTLLKHKLLKIMNKYSNIQIISPLTLKTETCKLVYKPRIEITGKRIIKEELHLENYKGIQATKFDKWDMFNALIESDINIELKDWCIENKEKITKNKELPKPLDDIIDSLWVKEVIKTYNKKTEELN